MKSVFSFCIILLCTFQLAGQGNSLHFDGVDDYVFFNRNPSPQFGINDDFTIEVWVKAPTNQVDLGGTTNVIIFKGRPATSVPYSIRIGNGTDDVPNGIMAFRRVNNMGTMIQLYSLTALNDNNWHHVAVVKDGTDLHLYIDGVLENTETDFDSGNTNDNNSMYFGSRSPINDFFLGEIDEVRIWDVARTAEEINTFIEEELVENQEDLLRYFDFNQGTPGADNSGISRVFDYSNVVGRHGFLNNFSLTGNSSNFVSSNFQILAVPTLSQWGLIILSLLFFIFGINSIRSKVLKPKRA